MENYLCPVEFITTAFIFVALSCHTIFYSDINACMEAFKITESSTSNHNISYARCEPAYVN